MNRRLRATAARYSRLADGYVRFWAPVLEALSGPLLREVPRGVDLLDLGCGPGIVSATLRRRVVGLVGVDLSEVMAATAPFPAVVGDVERLPLAARAFDAVLCTFVLQHCPRPRAVLREARRVLRPGGTLALATWGRDAAEDSGPWEAVTRRLDEAGAGPDPGGIATWHALVDTPQKVGGLARAAGFRLASCRLERRSYGWDPEAFLSRLRMDGPWCRRLETLPAGARGVVLDEIADDVRVMGPDDLRWEADVVFCLASATGRGGGAARGRGASS